MENILEKSPSVETNVTGNDETNSTDDVLLPAFMAAVATLQGDNRSKWIALLALLACICCLLLLLLCCCCHRGSKGNPGRKGNRWHASSELDSNASDLEDTLCPRDAQREMAPLMQDQGADERTTGHQELECAMHQATGQLRAGWASSKSREAAGASTVMTSQSTCEPCSTPVSRVPSGTQMSKVPSGLLMVTRDVHAAQSQLAPHKGMVPPVLQTPTLSPQSSLLMSAAPAWSPTSSVIQPHPSVRVMQQTGARGPMVRRYMA